MYRPVFRLSRPYRPLIVATIVVALLPGGCSALNNLPGIPHQSGAATNPNAGLAPDKQAGCVNGNATYTQTGSKNVLAGTCTTVIVSGNGISLTGANMTHLTLSGNDITAGVSVVGDVTISGSNDTLKLTGVGPVTISGDNNSLTAIGSIGDVTVVGSDNTVTTPGKIGTIIQSGDGNKIGAAG